MNKNRLIHMGVLAGVAVASAGITSIAHTKNSGVKSGVVRVSVNANKNSWGGLQKVFTGESHGTRDLFVSTLVIKPGKTVHAPHRHSQEEFMTIIDGRGTWHLDGKDIPAKKGDVIYTEPWILHGLTNTGKKPLTYFVVQFHGRGIAPAPEPE